MKKVVALILAVSFASAYAVSVKRGDKGYGLTSFHPDKKTRFEVEVIGVLHGVFPKGDLILAKLSGEVISNAGVSAGMSGSPVWINGKLVGAVAYTWSFQKEPICGITPISVMTDTTHPATPLKGISITQIPLVLGASGGVGFDLVKSLETNLNIYAVPSVQGNGAGIETDSTNLEEGDAVMVMMITGDVEVGAMGTMTFKNGKDFYIFGHPFRGGGREKFPVAKAKVFGVMPSSYLSFKLGERSSKFLGATVFDGMGAVKCRFGEKAEMIPVEVKVNSEKFHYAIANVKSVIPSMLNFVVMSSIEKAVEFPILSVAKIKAEIKYRDDSKTRTAEFENETTLNGSWDFLFFIADVSTRIFSTIWNPYKEVKIHRVKITIDIKQSNNFYRIDAINPVKPIVKEGETAEFEVVLRKFRGGHKRILVKFPIPYGIKGQFVVSANPYRSDFPKTEVPPELDNLSLFLERTFLNYHARVLSISLLTQKPSKVWRGQNVTLPPSTKTPLTSLPNGKRKNNSQQPVMKIRKFIKVNGPVFGSANCTITVVD